MKSFQEIRNLTEATPEEKAAKKQQSINRILDQFRSHRMEKADANQRLREKGHPGVTEDMLPQPGEAPRCAECGRHRDANIHLKQYSYHDHHEYREPEKSKPVKEGVITEAKKKKSLKTFRGSRTLTGEQPNPVDTEPKLKLNKAINAMGNKGY
jgi:hypothetical protein